MDAQTTIEHLLASGEITPDQLRKLANSYHSSSSQLIDATQADYMDELQSEGFEQSPRGALTLVGIVVLLVGVTAVLANFWSLLGVVGQLCMILSLWVGPFVLVALYQNKETRALNSTFSIIAGLLTPVAIPLIFSSLQLQVNLLHLTTLIALGMTIGYGIAVKAHNRLIFRAFAIASATALAISGYFSVLQVLTTTSDYYDFYLVAIAISYLYLAMQAPKKMGAVLSPIMAIIGTVGLFIFLISRGYSNEMRSVWDVATPFIIALLARVSISRKLLVVFIPTVFAVVAYLIKVSAAYFPGVTAWPFILLAAGVILVGSGSYWRRTTTKA